MGTLEGIKDKYQDSLLIRRINWLVNEFIGEKLKGKDLMNSPKRIHELNKGIQKSLGEPAENYEVFLSEFLNQAYSSWPTYRSYREFLLTYDDFIEEYKTGLELEDWWDEIVVYRKILEPLEIAEMFTKENINLFKKRKYRRKMRSDSLLRHKYDELNEHLNNIETACSNVSEWQFFSELERFARLEKLNKKDQEDFLKKCNEADSELINRTKDLLEKTARLSKEMARCEIDKVVGKTLHSIFSEFGELNYNELNKMSGLLGSMLEKYYLDDSENELTDLEQLFTQSSKTNYMSSLITSKLIINIHTLLTPIWHSLTASLKNFRKHPTHYHQNKYRIGYNYNGRFDFNSNKIHIVEETQIHIEKFLSLLDGFPLDRIDNCQGCSRWFIKTKTNKDYCSTKCASKVRQRQYRERHRDEYNKKQRELMRKKSQSK